MSPRTAVDPPGLSEVEKAFILDQAFEDYRRQVEAGAAPDPAEIRARYATSPKSVRRLIEVALFCEDNLHLLWQAAPPTEPAPPPGPVAWPEPGSGFLGFVLFRELGRGAFARVYLAVEPALGNRLVALKVTPHGAGEAETLGRISHPNVVPVYSVQQDPATGLSVVCMPYLGSATLDGLLRRNAGRPGNPDAARAILEAAADSALTEEDAATARPDPVLEHGTYVEGVLHLGTQVAEALAFLHERGICHRDLKPSNVLLSPDGRPMLLDFNLAIDRGATRHDWGGSLPYMAPEQLLVMGGAVTMPVGTPCDVFALGVLLYELLAGRHPFRTLSPTASNAAMRRHLLARQRLGFPPLREAAPRVGRAFARLAERCLAFNPEDRPRADELAAGLRRCRRSALRQARLWLGRHLRAASAAGVFLLAAGSAAAYLAATRPPAGERLLRHGRDAYRQGQYPRAVEQFTRALEADPSLTSARLARARAHQRLGDFQSAYADYWQADQSEPSPRTEASIAYCANRLQLTAVARDYYLKALAGGFRTAEVVNNLGYSHLKLNEFAKAEACLRELIETQGRMEAVDGPATLRAAYHNRALLDLQEPNRPPTRAPRRGLDDIRQALEIGPGTAELYFDAARLHAVAAQRRADTLHLAAAAGMVTSAAPFMALGVLQLDPSSGERIDRSLAEQALAYLDEAVRRGHSTRTLQSDVQLKVLAADPRFQRLAHQKPTHPVPPPARIRVVDPLGPDLP